MQIQVSREIDAPAGRVWELITDLDGALTTTIGRPFQGSMRKMIRRDLDGIAAVEAGRAG